VGVATNEIVIYTDGACLGNPGPGGWGAVLLWKKHKKEISGYETHTTNNRMELQAVIEALKSLKRKNLPVRIVTDSKYVQHAFTKNWLDGWIRRGWITAEKTPVKNRDQWEQLLELTAPLQVQWDWTKGHANDKYNNRCDELARNAIERGR
jgi:ribonuclease HI